MKIKTDCILCEKDRGNPLFCKKCVSAPIRMRLKAYREKVHNKNQIVGGQARYRRRFSKKNE